MGVPQKEVQDRERGACQHSRTKFQSSDRRMTEEHDIQRRWVMQSQSLQDHECYSIDFQVLADDLPGHARLASTTLNQIRKSGHLGAK